MTSSNIEVLKRFIPLSTLPEKHLEDLAQSAKVIKVGAKTLLFKRNVNTKERFYLVSGKVDICDDKFSVKTIESSAETPFFYPLDSSNPTIAAAITSSASTLLLVDSDRLDLVMTWSQAGDYLVEDLNEDGAVNNSDDWMSDLLQSNLFQKIPPSNIQQLFTSFKQENFRKGQEIIRQGDKGEHFYVLQQGTAQVYSRSEQGQEQPLATLSAGKFFGEEALISDSPRNASVKMITDGSCMKLDKASFNRLLKEPILNIVSAKKVKAMQLENPKIRIVDLRTQDEVKSEPLENVMHIPFSDLRQRIDSLDKDLTYITHAINGRRAELGAYLLNHAGFEALVMK